MDIYKFLEVAAVVFAVLAVSGSFIYIILMWLFSRETHIEPINVEPQRTHKFPKIDISAQYRSAKVGDCLNVR